MDTNLARRITATNDEYERLCSELELDGLYPDVIARLTIQRDRAKAELEVLIHTAQRQLVIDAAREATLESYRR